MKFQYVDALIFHNDGSIVGSVCLTPGKFIILFKSAAAEYSVLGSYSSSKLAFRALLKFVEIPRFSEQLKLF